MSDIKTYPTCGAKAKYKIKDTVETFEAVQDEEVLKKVGQLKKAMQKFKEKAEALEKELAFYRSVMVTDADVEGVAIHGVELSQGVAPEQYQLRLILTQLQKRKVKVKTNATVLLLGTLNGGPAELSLSELINKKLDFEFNYFQIMDSDFVLPSGFNLQRIMVKVKVAASRGVKGGEIEQVFNVPELLMGEKELRVILEQNSQVKDNSQ